MIDVKQAVENAKNFAKDLLGQQSDLLLEEVSSDGDAFMITLSLPRRTKTKENPLEAVPNGFGRNYSANREFKEFRVLKRDGSVEKMLIRQLA